MKNLKHFYPKLKFILSLLLVLSFLSSQVFSLENQKEKTYLITETELTTLENNLATYKQIASDLEIQTSQLKKSLATLEKENRKTQIKNSFIVGGITVVISVPIGIGIGLFIANINQ